MSVKEIVLWAVVLIVIAGLAVKANGTADVQQKISKLEWDNRQFKDQIKELLAQREIQWRHEEYAERHRPE